MAIGVIWKPPIDRDTYDAVREKVWSGAQENGQRFHAAGEGPEGWRIIEVWDSREGLERFREDILVPAFEEMAGDQAPPGGAPEPEVFELHFQG